MDESDVAKDFDEKSIYLDVFKVSDLSCFVFSAHMRNEISIMTNVLLRTCYEKCLYQSRDVRKLLDGS